MSALPSLEQRQVCADEAWADDWYLAYTKPRQEAVAADQLARQGYGVYLPLYKTWPKTGLKKTGLAPSAGVAFEPMFPRYVFFKPASAAQSLSPARSTRGVCTLVSFGLGPAQVNAALVDHIRSLETLRNAAETQTLSPFQPGTTVRLKGEQMQALQGMVIATSAQRVTLLLEILGRPTTVHTKHDQIELV
ncbi:MAG: transcriptional activator RfaH [Burkholderiaceae bacterium]